MQTTTQMETADFTLTSTRKLQDAAIGEIVSRSQIVCDGYINIDGDHRTLYMCVNMRGRKQWQKLDTVSVKNWRHGKEIITTHLQKHFGEDIFRNEWRVPIVISGITSSHADEINGTYYPMPTINRRAVGLNPHIGDLITYLRNGVIPEDRNFARWIYYVRSGTANNPGWQIWIGNTDNMLRRHACGWVRQHFVREDPHGTGVCKNFKKPWDIKYWRTWDKAVGNSGTWGEPNGNTIGIKLESEEATPAFVQRMKEQVKEAVQLTTDLTHEITVNNEKMARNMDIVNKHIAVSKVLFNNLSKDEREKLLKKQEFKDLFKRKELCSVCFSKAKIKGCVHFDCPGACEKCRNTEENGSKLCLACGKKQVLQCPICFDTYSINYLNIFKCGHCSCYKCCFNAHEHGRPLKKCPKCRKAI